MTNKKYKCPACKATIDGATVAKQCAGFVRFDIPDEIDWNDIGSINMYFCPECGDELNLESFVDKKTLEKMDSL